MRNDRSGIGTGITLITIGLLFMADRQGYMSFNNLWPLIIVMIGVTKLLFPSDSNHVGVIAGRRGGMQYRSGRVGSGIWLIFIGGMLFAHQNHWMSFRDSWPLFIVAGGLGMIFGRRRTKVWDPARADANGNSAPGTQEGGQWR